MALNLTKAYTPVAGQIANAAAYNTDIATLFNAFSALEAQSGSLGGLKITPSSDGTAFQVTDSAGIVVFSVNTSTGTIDPFRTRNWIINGTGEVYQRSASYTLVKDTYGYGPDRFAGMATGTLVSAGVLTQTTACPVGRTGFGFHFDGVTLTGTGVINLRYRMEAKDALKFKNSTASFQARVYHDVGSAVTYTVYMNKADAANNFSAVTAIGNNGGTAVSSATDTVIKYENVSVGDCSNGLEIKIAVSAGAITTKDFHFTEMQLELGTTATAYQYKDFDSELAACYRYYEKSYAYATAPATVTRNDAMFKDFAYSSGTSYCGINIPFRREKIAAATMTIYSPKTGTVDKGELEVTALDVSITKVDSATKNAHVYAAIGGAPNSDILRVHYTAVSEL